MNAFEIDFCPQGALTYILPTMVCVFIMRVLNATDASQDRAACDKGSR